MFFDPLRFNTAVTNISKLILNSAVLNIFNSSPLTTSNGSLFQPSNAHHKTLHAYLDSRQDYQGSALFLGVLLSIG